MNLENRFFIALFTLIICSNSAMADYLCTTKLRNNLRDAPSSQGRKLKTLPRYTPLKIVSNEDNWYEVQGKDFHGYIHHSIVSKDFKCMTPNKTKDIYCTNKKERFKRKIVYRESFKILKTEIACNYVQDKWGRKAWLSSLDIWPPENAKLLHLNF